MLVEEELAKLKKEGRVERQQAIERTRVSVDACVDRDAFHTAACAAVREAVRGLEHPRAVRKAERDAIIRTLCEFGLARVHRGPRPRAGSIPMPVRPMLCGTDCAGRLD